jgi:hypothetical protein
MDLKQDDSTSTPSASPLFRTPTPEPSTNRWLTWGIAAAVVLVLLGGILLLTHRKPPPPANAILPLAPYAQNLVITIPPNGMSESTSLSGGKSTFIDGRVKNIGSRTVTGATVQVLFGNFDPTQPPQLESTPLTLIRTHDPYIDIEPLEFAPLAPGDDREFRLIFEDISPNWDQQLPVIHAVQVTLK